MVEKNVMWLQNPGTADVSLADLGVKVPAGKTINVYQANPYLTVEQITISKKTGSLARRLDSGIIRIVRAPVANRPPTLDHLKASKKAVTARKTKTSVVIDADSVDESEGGGFEFADYGVNDIAPIVRPERENDSVLVNVKQDAAEAPQKVSAQSKDIMENFQKNASDPIGPLAPMESPPGTPMVVVKTPKAEKQEPVKAPVVVADPTQAPEAPKPEVAKKQDGAVVVGTQTDQVRSLKAVAKGTQDGDVVPDDDIEGADKVIKEERPEGMRVATKTKDGVIVMQLKEDKEEATDKPVVKKSKSSK